PRGPRRVRRRAARGRAPRCAGRLPRPRGRNVGQQPGRRVRAPGPARRRWEDMVLYQIYPRSFADADGDGTGDLQGVIDRAGHLERLGVDGVWLSPIMRSPGVDHGYDVSDPRDVDPLF